MVRVIKLMSKDFAIKCPTQGICHHTDEQHEHDEMDVAAVHDFIHGIREFYTLAAGSANVCSAHLVRLGPSYCFFQQ